LSAAPKVVTGVFAAPAAVEAARKHFPGIKTGQLLDLLYDLERLSNGCCRGREPTYLITACKIVGPIGECTLADAEGLMVSYIRSLPDALAEPNQALREVHLEQCLRHAYDLLRAMQTLRGRMETGQKPLGADQGGLTLWQQGS
jgi:hypothetical protein